MPEPISDTGIYKQLSTDMRNRIKNIYQQVATVSNEGGSARTEALFTEANDQLDEVMRTTESAAMSIMDIVEGQLDLTQESNQLFQNLREKLGDDPDLMRLSALNVRLGQDLTSVLTTLSFQDITGQRIKKVMAALQSIQENVLELYISSGLVMEGAEKDPTKDVQSLHDEAEKAMKEYKEIHKQGSELKGPDKNGVSQSAIDDMLAQLGL